MNTNSKINVLSPQTVDHHNCVINIEPDGFVEAEVANKEKYTEEELEGVHWIARIINKERPNFTRSSLCKTTGPSLRIRFPEIYAGGGYAWLEPVFGTNEPTNELPNGFYMKSESDKKAIVKIEWREYAEQDNGPLISGEKHFGEAVQLHIYTKGLYAHKLRVQLKDTDGIFTDDNLTLDDKTDHSNELSKYFTRLIRVYSQIDNPEAMVQKVVVDIQLERRWEALGGSSLSIKPIFTTDVKDVAPPNSYPELKVTQAPENETVYSLLSKSGNQAVIVGNRITDVAHFKPCRFELITKQLGDESPLTLFDFKGDINIPTKEINIGTVAHADSGEKLTIKIEKLDTEDCAFNDTEDDHEITLLDTGHLELVYPEATIKQTATNAEVSFIPKYPYDLLGEDDYLAFFMNYFPPLFNGAEQSFLLPVKTCAFSKILKLSVYPDVAFAYHLQIGEPEDYTQSNKLYFREIDVKDQIKRGVAEHIVALRKGIDSLSGIQRVLLNGTLSPLAREILLDYIEYKGENFAAGFHGYHTFTTPTTPTIMDYGEKYKWIPNTYIISGLVVSAAIDALIIYLTRGRAAAKPGTLAAAYKKYKKIKRIKKTIGEITNGTLLEPPTPTEDGLQTEFIWPQISVMNGLGYIQGEDQNSCIEYVIRVNAAPLFGLQHGFEGTLGSLVANLSGITQVFDVAEQVVGLAGKLKNAKSSAKDVKEFNDKRKNNKTKNNKTKSQDLPVEEKEEEKSFTQKWFKFKDINAFLEELEKQFIGMIDYSVEELTGTKAKVSISLKGFCSVSYELKFQTGTNTMLLDYYDDKDNIIATRSGIEKVAYGTDYGIDFEIKLEASNKITQKWSKLTEYIPVISLNDTRTEVETEGKIKSALNFERTFTYSKDWAQPVTNDKVIFTGVVLIVFVKIEFEERDDEDGDFGVVYEENLGTKEEPLKGVLIPGFTIKFGSQPIFENII